MITIIENLPERVAGFSASGQVSGDDYRDILIPAVESRLEKFGKIRLLYHIGPAFKRFTTTALWDDAKVGMHHLSGFERIAIVSDVGWIRTMARGMALAMPEKVRAFDNSDLNEAKRWIAE